MEVAVGRRLVIVAAVSSVVVVAVVVVIRGKICVIVELDALTMIVSERY